MRSSVAITLVVLVLGAALGFGLRSRAPSVGFGASDPSAPDGTSVSERGVIARSAEGETGPDGLIASAAEREGRVRSAGAGSLGSGEFDSGKIGHDALARGAVEFRAATALVDVSAVVLCARADGGVATDPIPIRPDGVAIAQLEFGRYAAAVQVDGAEQGPCVEFVHNEVGSQVILPLPEQVSLTYVALASDSRAAVVAAQASLRRTDLLKGEFSLECESGIDGRVTFGGLFAGQYELSLAADGYVESQQEIELPGSGPRAAEWGLVDIGYWLLDPLTRIVFELDGHDDWISVQGGGFTLKVVGETEALLVDDSGLLNVVLGDYDIPLEVVVDYPTGERAIVYVDEDGVFDGARCRIDVRREAEIEVDLRVSSATREELFSEEVYLQATFVRPGGGSTQLNLRVNDEGVYSLLAPFPRSVTVSVTSVVDGGMRMWVAANHDAAGSETSRILLNVVAPPRMLRVTRRGQGCPDAYVLARMVPDRSLWVAGGPADEDGLIALPSIDEGDVVVDVSVGDDLLAINLPIVLRGPEQTIDLSLDEVETYLIDVAVDGKPSSGRRMRFMGAVAQDRLDFSVGTSGADGVIRDVRFVPGSQVAVLPDPRMDLWPLIEWQRIQPGLNRVELFSKGVLAAPQLSALVETVWEHDGTPISAWIDEGRTSHERSVSHAYTARVPVGTYTAIGPDGEPVSVYVGPGQVVSIY